MIFLRPRKWNASSFFRKVPVRWVLFPECVTKGSRFLGVWGLDPCSPPVGRCDVFRDVFASFFTSFSRRKFRVYGESCKTSIVLMRSRRRVYGVSCKTSVSASPLASPCLWGKLQNLSLCFSSGVAVSFGKGAKPPCLLVLCRRRVYGGSCKTSFVLLRSRRRVYGGSCKTSFWRRRVYGGSCKPSSACPLASLCLWGKLQNLVLASPCLWGKLQTFVSACPLASPCLWGKLQNFGGFDALTSPRLWGKLVVHSTILGMTLRKLCSTQ